MTFGFYLEELVTIALTFIFVSYFAISRVDAQVQDNYLLGHSETGDGANVNPQTMSMCQWIGEELESKASKVNASQRSGSYSVEHKVIVKMTFACTVALMAP